LFVVVVLLPAVCRLLAADCWQPTAGSRLLGTDGFWMLNSAAATNKSSDVLTSVDVSSGMGHARVWLVTCCGSAHLVTWAAVGWSIGWVPVVKTHISI